MSPAPPRGDHDINATAEAAPTLDDKVRDCCARNCNGIANSFLAAQRDPGGPDAMHLPATASPADWLRSIIDDMTQVRTLNMHLRMPPLTLGSRPRPVLQ